MGNRSYTINYEGGFVTYDLFVSPLPKRELVSSIQNRSQASKHYRGRESDLTFEEVRKRVSSIDDLIGEKKYEVFGNLSSRLRIIIRMLRGMSLVDTMLANFSLVDVIMFRNPDLEREHIVNNILAFRKVFFKNYKSFNSNPYDESVHKALEEELSRFHRDCARPLQEEEGIKIEFFDYVFSGTICNNPFSNSEEFFRYFDTYAQKGKPIVIVADGSLKAHCLLTTDSKFRLRELEYEDGYDMKLVAPVRLRIKFPRRYTKKIEPLFEGLEVEYRKQAIPVEELVELKSQN